MLTVCVEAEDLTSLLTTFSQSEKQKGSDAPEVAWKCHGNASVEAVKLPPGMFIATHPWPFGAPLPVYGCFFVLTGPFTACFKEMKL